MTISTTAYGKTRAANANVDITTGAASWAINFSWSNATASSVTYFSNGSGTASSSTSATVTVYTNSMPVKLIEVTGTSDPTVTINNVTAYSGSSQTGSSTGGASGVTYGYKVSDIILRPTSTSNSTTQYYSYYTAPTTRTLSFDANGGTGAPAAQTGSDSGSGATITITASTPTRTGYNFNGWNTNSAGTGTDYASGGSITISSNITLYAKWTAITYTISYDANGGTGAPSSQTKTYGVALTLSSTTPTRTGYTFNGWNTASGGGGTSYIAGGSYTANAAATLYAQWTQNATVPGSPTSPSMGSSTLTRSLNTSLTRNSATNKTQYWYGSIKADFTMTWTDGSGATSSEVLYTSSSTTPASSATATWTNITTGSQSDYWYYGSSSSTYYYWVRSRNAQGVSAWVSLGSKTIPALSVTAFSIRIYRGNGSAYSNPTTAPAWSDPSYTWTGLTNRDASPDYGHYGWVGATLNSGTAQTATSSTV